MKSSNHRSRVGAEKRERMLNKLVISALQVFTQKGSDAAGIEDVIVAARVSRGTFYNYFRTNEELMQAVVEAVSNELLALIDACIQAKPDPAARIAAGLRMVLRTTQKHPLFASFVTKVGIERMLADSLAVQYLKRDIQHGIEEGRFDIADPELGVLLVAGAAQAAIMIISHGRHSGTSFCDELAYHVLLSLGMSRIEARKVANEALEEVSWPVGSLLSRTQHLDDPDDSLVPVSHQAAP